MSDHYVLHIGAHPDDSHVKSKKEKDKQKVKVEKSASVNEKSGILFWIWDKIEFVLVSGFVFALIYGFLNWQALALNASYYWGKFNGVERPLERLVQDDVEPSAPERLLSVSDVGSSNQIPIPPLDIEIVPPDTRLVVPRINQNVPIIGVKNENLIARQWDALERDIQDALQSGVIHYPGTALPGDGGNVVLTGHSSYYAWDPGRFKDVFALLHDVKIGDKLVLYFNQKKYIYEVAERKIVLPQQVDVLASTDKEQLTLLTCTPIGTNLKRLVLTANLVSVQ